MARTEGSSARRLERRRRRRLLELLSPDSELRSSSWEAPPPGFAAFTRFDELPERVEGEEHLFLVPDFELAEELVRRGADSARIAVDLDQDAGAWLAAIGRSRPGDPLIPPRPFHFPRRCLVVLPTYNERENLAPMVRAIHRYLETDVLVVDDASPDGTGEVADAIAAADPRVKVLHRRAKEGLGKAYLAGFRQALEEGYERVFEMDCDFSHAPWDLPRLAAACERADLAVGSRYVRGGSTEGWSAGRRLLSRGANLYTRSLLTRRIHDWTAGFRCYRAELLERLDLDEVAASGYSFQIEMTWRALRAGAQVVEIPIRFVERGRGKSKMDRRIALEAVGLVPKLRFKA